MTIVTLFVTAPRNDRQLERKVVFTHFRVPMRMAMPAIFSVPDREALGTDGLEAPSRLRLIGCRVEHGRGAVTHAFVECDGPVEGQRMVGQQQGSTCPGGDLRLAALATLDVITQATNGTLRLELLGVKPIRAFDTNLIVVAVQAHYEGTSMRVVGSAIADDNVVMGTARATLHALNRLASPLLSRLES